LGRAWGTHGIELFEFGCFFFLAQMGVFGEDEGGAADASEGIQETSVV